MALNVNRKVDDPFYRYKMPKLIAKVEGRGNGIKTVIPNMVEIARALDRPPTYTTKYFGCELGAQTQWDEKAERYIVNGAHQDVALQNLLDGFIEKFVLCPGCFNPETRLKVLRKGAIEQTCVACGLRGPLKSNHRLVQFILSHPPEDPKAAKTVKGAKAGKAVAGKKAGKKNKRSDGGDDSDEGSDEAPSSATPHSAALDNVAQRESGVVEAPETRDVDDDDWSVDVSAEAVRAREEAQLAGAVSKLVLANDAERSIEDKLELFHGYVLERRDQEKFPAKDVLAMAERLECKEKGVMVLVELLLDSDDIIPLIKRHMALLQRFTDGSKKTQKYLLHAFEKMVEKRPVLLNRVASIFMCLYECDIVEEMAFVSWHEKVTKKYVSKELCQQIHDKAAPFLNWLEKADSEDDEDEDEVGADEDEVAFDAGVSTIVTQTVPVAVNGKESADSGSGAEEEEDDEAGDDEDDLDIDNI